MNVKACDECKKPNTTTQLFRFIPVRASGDPRKIGGPQDPVIGLTLVADEARVSFEGSVPNERELCLPCAEKSANVIFAELSKRAAVPAPPAQA